MASYAAVLVLSGYSCDLTKGEIGFDPKVHDAGSFMTIWSAGTAWGSSKLSQGFARLEVHGGTVSLKTISIAGIPFDRSNVEMENVTISADENGKLQLTAGSVLTIEEQKLSLAKAHDLAH